LAKIAANGGDEFYEGQTAKDMVIGEP